MEGRSVVMTAACELDQFCDARGCELGYELDFDRAFAVLGDDLEVHPRVVDVVRPAEVSRASIRPSHSFAPTMRCFPTRFRSSDSGEDMRW